MSREPSRAWLACASILALTLTTGTCVAFKLSLRSVEDEGLRRDVEPYARIYGWTIGGLDGATPEEKPRVVRSWTTHGAPQGWGPPRTHGFELEGTLRKTGQPGRITIEWSIARHDWTRLN